MRTVVVCGGRSFRDANVVWRELGAAHKRSPISLVVTGGAAGADALAASWARAMGLETRKYPAHWELLGRAAGPVRNATMLKAHPDADVIAFPGGNGTADMVRRAREAGRQVLVVEGMT